jgi:hypothetical protein
MAHLIDTVRGLEARGVAFRSLTEGIDTTTPSGTLIFHIFGALAQFERDLIRDLTAMSHEVDVRVHVGLMRYETSVIAVDFGCLKTHLAAALSSCPGVGSPIKTAARFCWGS